MTITAKFASQCPNCRQQIAVGSKVEWVRGQKATHVACPTTADPDYDMYLSEQEMDRDDASYMAWLARPQNRPAPTAEQMAARISIRPVAATVGTDNDDRSYEAWQTFQAQMAQCGVYVLPDETIVRIKMNLEKTGNYTKRWVHISGLRLTEEVDPETLKNNRSHGDYEYAPELKAQALTVGRKMTRDEALKFSTIYGICAWCGRTLVAAKSVERGIGPVCIKRFAEGTTAADLMVAA